MSNIPHKKLEEFEQKYRQIFTEFESVNSTINLLKKMVNELFQKNTQLEQLICLHKKTESIEKKQIEEIEKNFLNEKFFVNKINSLSFEVDTLAKNQDHLILELQKIIIKNLENREIEENKEKIEKTRNQREFEKVYSFIRNEIQNSKEEILNLPSEAKEVKKEIESKMSNHTFEFERMRKEIENLKKGAFVQKKHIEYLMTEINRLKAGK